MPYIIIIYIGSQWNLEFRRIWKNQTIWICCTWLHWCVCCIFAYSPLLLDLMNRYSRRILWLEACITNNDPQVIAWYYLRCVKQILGIYSNYYCVPASINLMNILGTPKLVRCDCGTENIVLAYLQPFLSREVNSKSFCYGSSVSNQVYILL